MPSTSNTAAAAAAAPNAEDEDPFRRDLSTLQAVDHENNTPLHYACNGANYETIALLLGKYDAVSVSDEMKMLRRSFQLKFYGSAMVSSIEKALTLSAWKASSYFSQGLPESVTNGDW